MNDFNIDITVKQFINKFFLSSIDWIYCYVDFPDEKYQELGGKWEVSEVICPKKDRSNFDDFLNFWGNLNVCKVQITNNGFYPSGDELKGVGMIIYVKYEEGMFK